MHGLYSLGAFSPEKEADRGGHILTSSEYVVKTNHEIKFIEHKENHLNNLSEMVREHNYTTYTLLAVTPITVHVPASTPSDDFK